MTACYLKRSRNVFDQTRNILFPVGVITCARKYRRRLRSLRFPLKPNTQQEPPDESAVISSRQIANVIARDMRPFGKQA